MNFMVENLGKSALWWASFLYDNRGNVILAVVFLAVIAFTGVAMVESVKIWKERGRA